MPDGYAFESDHTSSPVEKVMNHQKANIHQLEIITDQDEDEEIDENMKLNPDDGNVLIS